MSGLKNTRVRKTTGYIANSKQKEDKDASFFEHLEELRWHLIRAIAAVLVAAIAIFIIGKPVFEQVVLAPKNADFITYRMICALSESMCFTPPDFNLETRQLGEQFVVHLKTSALLGLMVSFPYVFWEIWRFLRPGLHSEEQKTTRGVIFMASLLFYLGVAFGYFIIAPFAVTFLASYDMGAVSAPTLASYTGYLTMFTLPTGIIFQMPLVIFFMTRLGVVTSQGMRAYRRYSFVAFLILAAIITPPDGVTQLLIAFPLYALYEISIFVAQRQEKRLTPSTNA